MEDGNAGRTQGSDRSTKGTRLIARTGLIPGSLQITRMDSWIHQCNFRALPMSYCLPYNTALSFHNIFLPKNYIGKAKNINQQRLLLIWQVHKSLLSQANSGKPFRISRLRRKSQNCQLTIKALVQSSVPPLAYSPFTSLVRCTADECVLNLMLHPQPHISFLLGHSAFYNGERKKTKNQFSLSHLHIRPFLFRGLKKLPA